MNEMILWKAAMDIVDRLNDQAQEYGEHRLAHVSEQDIQTLKDALAALKQHIESEV